MGYHLNGLDEPVFLAVSKPLLTEFGIHHELESCGNKIEIVFCEHTLSDLAVDLEGPGRPRTEVSKSTAGPE